jgi:putative chitinase
MAQGRFQFDNDKLVTALDQTKRFFHADQFIKSAQISNLNVLINMIEADQRWETLEQVAYFLATVAHECAKTLVVNGQTYKFVKTFAPVHEAGSAKYFEDRYGFTKPVGKRLGNKMAGDGALFHGRGYVQVTGRSNYTRLGAALVGRMIERGNTTGLPGDVVSAFNQVAAGMNSITIDGSKFVTAPDLALIPWVSYENAVNSMFAGSYTGKKITDYISPGHTDYVNARRVINGTDRAMDIANIARDFENALWKAQEQTAEDASFLGAPSLAVGAVGVGAASMMSTAGDPSMAVQGFVSTPDTPPIQTETWMDKIKSAVGYIGASGGALLAWVQANPKIMYAVAGVIVLCVVLYFVRQIILDKEKMRINADPRMHNVK